METIPHRLLTIPSLYRRLLRVHRKLSIEMRSLGDDYVKAEFRRHRNVDNPLQIVAFLSQWKLYLDGLELDQGGHNGRRLDPDTFEKVRPTGDIFSALHDVADSPRPFFRAHRLCPRRHRILFSNVSVVGGTAVSTA